MTFRFMYIRSREDVGCSRQRWRGKQVIIPISVTLSITPLRSAGADLQNGQSSASFNSVANPFT